MASRVLKMSVPLDGYVAPIDGSTDWIAAGGSDDALSWTVETVSNAGAHLMGATTFAVMAAHWPSASGPFAKPMNEIPKVVFSDSLASAGWGETTIAGGDPAEAITRLKQERSADEPCRGDRLAESAAGPAIGHLGHDGKQQPAIFGDVGVHPGDADGQDDHEHACRRTHPSSLDVSRAGPHG